MRRWPWLGQQRGRVIGIVIARMAGQSLLLQESDATGRALTLMDDAAGVADPHVLTTHLDLKIPAPRRVVLMATAHLPGIASGTAGQGAGQGDPDPQAQAQRSTPRRATRASQCGADPCGQRPPGPRLQPAGPRPHADVAPTPGPAKWLPHLTDQRLDSRLQAWVLVWRSAGLARCRSRPSRLLAIPIWPLRSAPRHWTTRKRPGPAASTSATPCTRG